jgi:CBS domain-containing protein
VLEDLAMEVRKIMTRNVEVIHPDRPIQEAAERMKELDVGPLPVCEGDRLVGMLTDRDITVRAVADGYDPWTTPVRDVMTREVDCCFEDDDVANAARIMEQKQILRLLVLNRDRRLVGIVSLADLAVTAADEQMTSETVQRISEPAEPNR